MFSASIFKLNYWYNFWHDHADAIISTSIKILFIILIYYIIKVVLFRLIGHAANSFISKVSDSSQARKARRARIGALQSMLGSTIGFVFGFIALSMILEASGIDIKSLITVAGVAGLAFGFGAQKLVKDVISGVFILIEDQYGVGDYVTIGAITGSVIEVGMRITRIKDTSGKLCTIANGDIVQVCNHSRGELTITHDVSVPASENIDKVRKVLAEVGKSITADMPSMMKKEFTVIGLSQISAASISLRMQGCAAPECQESIKIELNTRIKEAFEKNSIPLA